LETARAPANKVILYEIENNHIVQTLKSGDDFPYSDKGVHHRLNVFTVEIDKEATKSFVLQLESDGETITFPLTLYELLQFWEKDATNEFVLGIYYGILILVIIIYFFFYRLLLNRSFLYYILYVLSVLILQLSLDGYVFKYVFSQGGYLANHCVLFVASLTVMFLILYAKTYLNTKENSKRINKLFNFSMWAMAVFMLASFIPGKPYQLAFPGINGLGLLGVILILIAIFSVRKKGVKVSAYFTWAFIFLITGAMLFILGNFNLLNNDALTSNALKTGSVMEIIALSVSMAYKYRELQQEKELAQAGALINLEQRNKLIDDQKVELEKQVRERVFELNKQTEKLGVKNREIIDSINYAKRLQDALIPPVEVFQSIMPNSFILFEPKDIVSGDFYLITEVTTIIPESKNHEKLILFSVGDCTGHGVPGAFMSIIGIQIFNQCIKKAEINTTSSALDFLNTEVYNAVNIHRVGDMVIRDGMDLALCAFNPRTLQLYYSGAKNPIYIVRNKEVTIIKGDNQPIGSSKTPKPFTQHFFQLEKGDMLYLFTDGLPDQFGGPKGKKFKYKKFQEILINNSSDPIGLQKDKLLTEFTEWKGSLEQLDDVCVIGIRI
jgi:two-component system, sensor histidine kinase LadS